MPIVCQSLILSNFCMYWGNFGEIGLGKPESACPLNSTGMNFTFGLSPPSVGKSKTVWVDVRVSAKIKRTAPAKDKLLIKNFGSDKILYPIHCMRIIPKRI